MYHLARDLSLATLKRDLNALGSDMTSSSGGKRRKGGRKKKRKKVRNLKKKKSNRYRLNSDFH